MSTVHKVAQGDWFGILSNLQVPIPERHKPCPMCGGKDRFDINLQQGIYHCRGCGGGTLIDYVMKYNDWDFRQAALEIEGVTGSAPTQLDRGRVEDDYGKRIEVVTRALSGAVAVRKGDPVDKYLTNRGLSLPSAGLFYQRSCWGVGMEKPMTAMIAPLLDKGGAMAGVHKTFLDRGRKANIEAPKQISKLPGTINGSAIRLYPSARVLGIAEGIETAIAASLLYGLPVWAAVSSTGMTTVELPNEVESVMIFADNDQAGFDAAGCLTTRLLREGREVCCIRSEGSDFAELFE